MTDAVTLTRAENQHLIDSRDHAVAVREVAVGATETLTGPSWTPSWQLRRRCGSGAPVAA